MAYSSSYSKFKRPPGRQFVASPWSFKLSDVSTPPGFPRIFGPVIRFTQFQDLYDPLVKAPKRELFRVIKGFLSQMRRQLTQVADKDPQAFSVEATCELFAFKLTYLLLLPAQAGADQRNEMLVVFLQHITPDRLIQILDTFAGTTVTDCYWTMLRNACEFHDPQAAQSSFVEKGSAPNRLSYSTFNPDPPGFPHRYSDVTRKRSASPGSSRRHQSASTSHQASGSDHGMSFDDKINAMSVSPDISTTAKPSWKSDEELESGELVSDEHCSVDSDEHEKLQRSFGIKLGHPPTHKKENSFASITPKYVSFSGNSQQASSIKKLCLAPLLTGFHSFGSQTDGMAPTLVSTASQTCACELLSDRLATLETNLASLDIPAKMASLIQATSAICQQFNNSQDALSTALQTLNSVQTRMIDSLDSQASTLVTINARLLTATDDITSQMGGLQLRSVPPSGSPPVETAPDAHDVAYPASGAGPIASANTTLASDRAGSSSPIDPDLERRVLGSPSPDLPGFAPLVMQSGPEERYIKDKNTIKPPKEKKSKHPKRK